MYTIKFFPLQSYTEDQSVCAVVSGDFLVEVTFLVVSIATIVKVIDLAVYNYVTHGLMGLECQGTKM